MKDVVVVNDKDEVIGTMSRKDAHENGTPHRIAVVYVTNPAGKFLVQVRVTGRLDHSAAGHVDPGEDYAMTAERELEEELGIRGAEINLIGSGVSEETLPDEGQHRVHVMQIFSCVAEPGELQQEEVRDVYWASPEEVLAEMEQNLEDKKFTGGFRTSLPIFINALANEAMDRGA